MIALVEERRAQVGIAPLCDALGGLPRATFYRRGGGAPPPPPPPPPTPPPPPAPAGAGGAPRRSREARGPDSGAPRRR